MLANGKLLQISSCWCPKISYIYLWVDISKNVLFLQNTKVTPLSADWPDRVVTWLQRPFPSASSQVRPPINFKTMKQRKSRKISGRGSRGDHLRKCSPQLLVAHLWPVQWRPRWGTVLNLPRLLTFDENCCEINNSVCRRNCTELIRAVTFSFHLNSSM